MPQPKTSPRIEFRKQESLRISSSPNLADMFPALKSLTLSLVYYLTGGIRQTTKIKYTVNLAHAKSAFTFNCPNTECVGGDFDLSNELRGAVATHQTITTGERCCQGWENKSTINLTRCHRVLRYELDMEYNEVPDSHISVGV